MRLVIQRVAEASVSIDGGVHAAISAGLLVLIGIHQSDTEAGMDKLVEKMLNLRIFSDEKGKMNLSVRDVDGDILLVSQFTLYGDAKKGNRPSFIEAGRPEMAIPLYELFIDKCVQIMGPDKVKTGLFGADMKVALVNDGPVTIII